MPSESEPTGRGVSPVIGVVLMVAVVVAIGAVLGAFVLSIQTPSHVAPHATFFCSGSGTSWKVTMVAGQSIPTDRLTSDGSINVYPGGDGTLDSGDYLYIRHGSKLIWQTNSSSAVLKDCKP